MGTELRNSYSMSLHIRYMYIYMRHYPRSPCSFHYIFFIMYAILLLLWLRCTTWTQAYKKRFNRRLSFVILSWVLCQWSNGCVTPVLRDFARRTLSSHRFTSAGLGGGGIRFTVSKAYAYVLLGNVWHYLIVNSSI